LIDPDWHVPLRGKPSAYALNVHSRAKLDGVYTYLPKEIQEIQGVYVIMASYVSVMFSNKL